MTKTEQHYRSVRDNVRDEVCTVARLLGQGLVHRDAAHEHVGWMMRRAANAARTPRGERSIAEAASLMEVSRPTVMRWRDHAPHDRSSNPRDWSNQKVAGQHANPDQEHPDLVGRELSRRFPALAGYRRAALTLEGTEQGEKLTRHYWDLVEHISVGSLTPLADML